MNLTLPILGAVWRNFADASAGKTIFSTAQTGMFYYKKRAFSARLCFFDKIIPAVFAVQFNFFMLHGFWDPQEAAAFRASEITVFPIR